MSLLVDELAAMIQQSTEDAEASRDDWERALEQIFGISPESDDWNRCSEDDHYPDLDTALTVTNISQKDGLVKDKPHVLVTVCPKRACLLDAMAWVERTTGEQAVWSYRRDAPTVWSSKIPARGFAEPGAEPSPSASTSWFVEWSIDQEDARTPLEAAARVWFTIFGRASATDSDACVFEVTGNSGVTTTIDLSEYDLPAVAEAMDNAHNDLLLEDYQV